MLTHELVKDDRRPVVAYEIGLVYFQMRHQGIDIIDDVIRAEQFGVCLNKRHKSPTDSVKRRFFCINRYFIPPGHRIVEYSAF